MNLNALSMAANKSIGITSELLGRGCRLFYLLFFISMTIGAVCSGRVPPIADARGIVDPAASLMFALVIGSTFFFGMLAFACLALLQAAVISSFGQWLFADLSRAGIHLLQPLLSRQETALLLDAIFYGGLYLTVGAAGYFQWFNFQWFIWVKRDVARRFPAHRALSLWDGALLMGKIFFQIIAIGAFGLGCCFALSPLLMQW